MKVQNKKHFSLCIKCKVRNRLRDHNSSIFKILKSVATVPDSMTMLGQRWPMVVRARWPIVGKKALVQRNFAHRPLSGPTCWLYVGPSCWPNVRPTCRPNVRPTRRPIKGPISKMLICEQWFLFRLFFLFSIVHMVFTMWFIRLLRQTKPDFNPGSKMSSF